MYVELSEMGSFDFNVSKNHYGISLKHIFWFSKLESIKASLNYTENNSVDNSKAQCVCVQGPCSRVWLFATLWIVVH